MRELGVGDEKWEPRNWEQANEIMVRTISYSGDTPQRQNRYFSVFIFFNVISFDYLSTLFGDTPQK